MNDWVILKYEGRYWHVAQPREEINATICDALTLPVLFDERQGVGDVFPV